LKNEGGFSFIETILTVSILMLIFGSLLPISYHMMSKLIEKKQEMHVAIVSNQAAIERKNGMITGSRVFDNVIYDWQWQSRTLCIQYLRLGDPFQSCETY
jgi:type II secretory pathway pseudopilin PulG